MKIKLIVFFIMCACFYLTSCCVSAYHKYFYASDFKGNTGLVKHIEIWQGQLLFPSEYKDLMLKLPDGSLCTVGAARRWTDPNIINASGAALGNVIGATGNSIIVK